MSNKEKFYSTVNILVRAYLNNTLAHGRCSACAVGNIIADSLGVTIQLPDLDWSEGVPYWNRVFVTAKFYGPHRENRLHEGYGILTQVKVASNYMGEAKFQIDSTGYTWQQLARIENVFETTPLDEADRMFEGLMRVVDVLTDIHQMDLEECKTAKKLFVV